ncbi:2-dehydropantoate 2-reductase [Lentibacillus populi]|uniref:2-dehydropantoate 2-reductase n=1 Tax=Lentibacillus populi TaxID=1827502 RepID=A0A9W5X5K0_9BACI|nr:ketopantoate reductase family protein [Lentibacillus populi]GGB44416.1 2-dehydropantoate 2-reductase [Lentibacillus populi]
MNIVVIGAGALGSYFGARFLEGGANVTFLVRERRAKQIEKNHIKLNSPSGDYTVTNPKIATDAAEIETADLVLVSVKGYHLPGTLADLKTLTKKGAHVLPVLNGIEHISYLQDQLGKDAVIGGLSFIIATLDENGHVIHSSDFHDLVFGQLEPTQTTICNQLENLCHKANVNGINSDTILLELWKKYTFITAFSGITTAANLPIGEIRDHDSTFRIAEMILQEMRTLAKAYNVEIPGDDVEMAKAKLLHLPEDATSSMHQDRRKGLPLEVDHLQGGALRLSKAAGVEMPYTETVYGLIKPFEKA